MLRIVDVSAVKSYYELYRTIAIAMDIPEGFGYTNKSFPEYFCQNTDALWDSLTNGGMEEETAVLRGFQELPKDLQEEAKDIIKIFHRAVTWHKGDFRVIVES